MPKNRVRRERSERNSSEPQTLCIWSLEPVILRQRSENHELVTETWWNRKLSFLKGCICCCNQTDRWDKRDQASKKGLVRFIFKRKTDLIILNRLPSRPKWDCRFNVGRRHSPSGTPLVPNNKPILCSFAVRGQVLLREGPPETQLLLNDFTLVMKSYTRT